VTEPALFSTPTEQSEERWTERRVLDLMGERYGNQRHRYGNGGIRYATAEHVRSHAGFDARRTADFVAMDLWTSSGLALHGHEVKVSRPDWLTELKQPEKAAEFTPYMTFWWLVVSDRSIVRDGELPDGWGLMVPRDGQLVVVIKARRRAPDPLPRTMLASLLRAVMKTAVARTASEVTS
jgi:hypothetical protein